MPILPRPDPGPSSSRTTPATLKPKPEPVDYGSPVPLSDDSDDEFNARPASSGSGLSATGKRRADGSPVGPERRGGEGGRKKARLEAGKAGGGARASPPKRSDARAGTSDKGQAYRFGAGSSDEDGGEVLRGGVTGGKGGKKRGSKGAGSDGSEGDDFGRAVRRQPAKKPLKRTAADRHAANPLRILAGPSPLSESDSDDGRRQTGETRAVIKNEVLRREKVVKDEGVKGKGKAREVIEIGSSEPDAGDPSPAPVEEVESSGSSCTSDDDESAQATWARCNAEVQEFGRVLGHRERRKLRRQREKTAATAQVVPMGVDDDDDDDESDDGDKTAAEIAAKIKRIQAAKAQTALAVAGPIVPPPPPSLRTSPTATAFAQHDADSETDDDESNHCSAQLPSAPAEDGSCRPAFHPPDAQRLLGPLELEAREDGTGPEATAVNAHINRQLREYQREGVRFLWSRYRDGKGGILGDDMGLGKTIQVIAFLSAIMRFQGEHQPDHRRRARWSDRLRKSGRLRDGLHHDNALPDEEWPTALVVAPGSVCENWIREFHTWGFFSVGYCTGGPKERASVMREFRQGWYDVVVMSIDTLRCDIYEVKDDCFSVVFVDEVHRAKNPAAAATKALKELECQVRFGLTGTAIQNRFEEFWCILDWARPGEVGTREEWEAFITKPIKLGQAHDATVDQVLLGRVRAAQLVNRILPHFFLRRTKALIAHQMPKKTDKVVLCSLTPRQFDCLERLRETPQVQQLLGLPPKQDLGPREKVELFRYLAMFKKVSNHLALILPQPDDDIETQRIARRTFETIYPEVNVNDLVSTEMLTFERSLCGKWQALNDLLDMWRPNRDSTENKVLIFSTSVRLLKIVAEFLRFDGRDFLFLHGGVATAERMPMVDKFQTDPSVYVFLISTLAGGVGLNLTAANKVVIFDPSWNPSNDLQAMDRAFRIGQKSDVEVFRLVAAGSIEENIYTRQLYKQQMSAIGYDGKHEKRMFQGIIDEKGQQGELFGVHNLFALKKDAIQTTDIRDRIRDAELPFVKPAGADLNDEKGGNLLISDSDKGKYEKDVGSLLEDNSRDEETPNEEIKQLLESAGAAYISSDKDVLGQEEYERKLFEECRRFRREHPFESKSRRAFDLEPDSKVKSPPKKAANGKKDVGSIFTPPVRVKKNSV